MTYAVRNSRIDVRSFTPTELFGEAHDSALRVEIPLFSQNQVAAYFKETP